MGSRKPYCALQQQQWSCSCIPRRPLWQQQQHSLLLRQIVSIIKEKSCGLFLAETDI